jgi:hypothetical protein
MPTLQLRRARRPDSLARAVIELLDDYQYPLSTQAVRVILTARGRPVPAERLSRLAAYQREDFERTRMPPELCWALKTDGSAVIPRWWARGSWRLMRRIQTNDAMPIWYATLATRLCRDLADQRGVPDPNLANLALAAANAALWGRRAFELPASSDDWMRLYREVYAPHNGALSNRTSGTLEQIDAEKALSSGAPGFNPLFGRT